MGERKRVTAKRRVIFGDTFAETAYFYKKPNVNVFIARLLHVASGGRVSVDADTSKLFARSRGKKGGKSNKSTTYRVVEAELRRLGCTKAALYETLRRTPGADPKHRHPDAAPLIVPAPGEDEAAVDNVGHAISPVVKFDDDDLLFYDDGLNHLDDDISLMTTGTHGDGGVSDPLDFNLNTSTPTPFDELFHQQEMSVLDELRIVERELEAVTYRIQKLVDRRRFALGNAPRNITDTLDNMREEVRIYRAAAEAERDAFVASDF